MRCSSQTGGVFLGLCRAAAGASSVKSEWQMERRKIKPKNGLSGRPGREGSCTALGLIRVTVLWVCSSQNRGVSYHGHDVVKERNSTGRVPDVTVLGTSGGWDWLLFLTAEFFTHPYSPACAVLCVWVELLMASFCCGYHPCSIVWEVIAWTKKSKFL